MFVSHEDPEQKKIIEEISDLNATVKQRQEQEVELTQRKADIEKWRDMAQQQQVA